MKVTRSSGPAAPASVGPRRADGRFAISGGAAGPEPATATARTTATASLAGLDALLALQETAGPLERRRRAVARGGRLLDGLDAVKLALIEGAPDSRIVEGLRGAVREQRERTDDYGLDALLDQIDLRAAVELAKRETRVAA